jgi:hypothetical protein
MLGIYTQERIDRKKIVLRLESSKYQQDFLSFDQDNLPTAGV